jgi:WD40 repeat protein
LPETEAEPVRAHLAGCARCQAALDQRSDDPDLRRWAPPGPALLTEVPTEPELARLLDAMCAPSGATRSGDTPPPADLPLRFLTPPARPGDLGTLGPYRVLRELGRGGMGIVLLAYDEELRRPVAVKVLPPEHADARARARFVREAQAAAGIEDDHVVRVYGVANPADGSPYLVMQFVDGPTLADRIKAEGRLDPGEAARICLHAALGLTAAHRAGLVHRDIKPANVILDRAQGRAKIMDFGLARATSLPGGITQAGTVLGTPEYMSPEQVLEADRVDARTDVYGLGVTLYEALTGEVPFRGLTHLVLQQVIHDDPRPPRRLNDKVPRDLETICLKCLHKEPARRYPSAGALAEDLRRFLGGEPIRARPVGAWERAAKWAKRRPAVAALLALVVFVTALGFGLVTWQWREAETARRGLATKAAELAAKAEELEVNNYFTKIALADRELAAKNWGRAEELLDECPPALRGWEWHYLKRRRHGDPLTLPLRQKVTMGASFDLAFSPDSRLLAVPGGDETIRVWAVATGQEVLALRGDAGRVLGVAFSPDGRRLASTSEDTTIRIWDLSGLPHRWPPPAMGKGKRGGVSAPSCTLRGHQDRVVGVAFSPDGRLLASASNDRTIKVWNAATGERRYDFPGQALPILFMRLAFSPDSRRLAAGSAGNTVRVWDVTSGETLFLLPGHSQPIVSVLFSADGQRLVSSGWDRLVKVWDLPPAAPGVSTSGGRILTPRHTLHDLSPSMSSVAFSPDGGRLAVGGPLPEGMVRVYDVTSGQLLRTLQGHVRVVSVAFSPDGRRLASAGMDKTVKLWDPTTGHEILTLRGHADLVGRVLFSPDGQCLVSASGDGTVRVWDATPFDPRSDPQTLTLSGHGGPVYGLAFRPDGRQLASASADTSLRLWDVSAGAAVGPDPLIRTFAGHISEVLCVAFSPDGRCLLSGSNDSTARFWDTRTGDELRALRGFKMAVRSVAFSPDGGTVATASTETAKLWDVDTGREKRNLPTDEVSVQGVAFSPDGKLLAACGGLGTGVWDVQTGKEVFSFREHRTVVHCLAFHPDGEYLASGDAEGKVAIWGPAPSPRGEPGGARKVRFLPGHTDHVYGIAFSPDGRYLATASWREIIVWDVKTWKPIQTLGRFAGTIWCVAFSPDSRRLAAGGGYKGKGEIKIWQASIWEKQA